MTRKGLTVKKYKQPAKAARLSVNWRKRTTQQMQDNCCLPAPTVNTQQAQLQQEQQLPVTSLHCSIKSISPLHCAEQTATDPIRLTDCKAAQTAARCTANCTNCSQVLQPLPRTAPTAHRCCNRSAATCEMDLPSALATASRTLKVSSSMLTCSTKTQNTDYDTKIMYM